MSKVQEPGKRSPIVSKVLTRLLAVVLAAFAIAAGVSTHEEPASRFVVLECRGFDALAAFGGVPVTCDAGLVREADGVPENAAAANAHRQPSEGLT
jgi:exosortase/archaeosortase